MKRLVGNWHRLLPAAVAALVLAGCGSGGAGTPGESSNPNPGPPDPPQVVIQGVATPNSVAVVTATNAD
jgi:hypothetical protein